MTPGSPPSFLDLIKNSRRGKLKIYLGMCAGVGKSYRMLQEAHILLRNGIDIRLAWIETHGRAETEALVAGLPTIPRKSLFYKGKALEEMDLATVLHLRPEVVIVDELAHQNVEGSKNNKRWQDVLEIINAGISVISALNIQHLESLNDDVQRITGIEVSERIPDQLVFDADEIVNIDLTAEELINRLKEGKIYKRSRIHKALNNFFQENNLLQLRELALRISATFIERKVETRVPNTANKLRHERFMACISTNEKNARNVIRKTARLAAYYHSPWMALYVQTPSESAQNISLSAQRHLINNLKLATELGGEIIRAKGQDVAQLIAQIAVQRSVTTLCIGKPPKRMFQFLRGPNLIMRVLEKLENASIDLVVLS